LGTGYFQIGFEFTMLTDMEVKKEKPASYKLADGGGPHLFVSPRVVVAYGIDWRFLNKTGSAS
jgi:hypothetical protein